MNAWHALQQTADTGNTNNISDQCIAHVSVFYMSHILVVVLSGELFFHMLGTDMIAYFKYSNQKLQT